jgi:hypothetical protein
MPISTGKMVDEPDKLPAKSSSADVAEFLDKLARTPAVRPAGGRGRLIFAMDATASREPTWDRACHIQGQMFEETASLGGLEVQLVFYRGFGECRASPWVVSSQDLVAKMTSVRCLGGQTQIARVLKHAVAETGKVKVNALVFVGDCMEEDVDELCHIAGQLGVLGVPCFMFHEGNDPVARSAFTQVAKLSGGAYCSFDASSAHMLRELLSAVAVFAAGGRRALEDYGKRAGAEVRRIASQVK